MIVLRNTVVLTDYHIDDTSLKMYQRSIYDDVPKCDKQNKLLKIGMQQFLTDKQREYLTLFYFEKMSKKDIAKKFNVNPSSVTRSIQSAKKKLSVLNLFLNI